MCLGEAALPVYNVCSFPVVDEINYGWTQHLTKSVAYTYYYTLSIGKLTFQFAAKKYFEYYAFHPQTEANYYDVCCSNGSGPKK